MENDFFKDLSFKLKHGRKNAGFSQKSLAERMLVSASTISRWENNSEKIPITKLSIWAEICQFVVEMKMSPRQDSLIHASEAICRLCKKRCEANRVILGDGIMSGQTSGGLLFYLSGGKVPNDCPFVVEQVLQKNI
jgi:transcriptional regulator with XRE-family HTH domain